MCKWEVTRGQKCKMWKDERWIKNKEKEKKGKYYVKYEDLGIKKIRSAKYLYKEKKRKAEWLKFIEEKIQSLIKWNIVVTQHWENRESLTQEQTRGRKSLHVNYVK